MVSVRILVQLAVISAGTIAAAGCGAAYYTEQANAETYAIVADKQTEAFGERSPFTIEPDPKIYEFFRRAAAHYELPEGLEPGDVPEHSLPRKGPGAVRITMAEALRLAVHANRNYQAEKEQVYLTALALTFERYLFDPQPFATGTVNAVNDTGAVKRTWDGTSDVGFSQQLADGATVVANLGLTALKFINKELGDTIDSTLDFSLRQPLWRGAGRRIVQENLRQAERNALYQVRSFARFEKSFAVDVATQYLNVLQERQIVLNEFANYQSLVLSRKRAEELAEAERLPEFQVDQARQDELRAYNRWIVERERYTNSVDAFKIQLGIPVVSPIELVPEEMERLVEAGLQRPDVERDEAVATALVTRLDLANTRGAVEDSLRKIVVAEDGLEGDVDLVASIGYASDNPNRSPESARLAFHRGDYSIGFDIDLPVDRLQERNALRRTQIDHEQAERNLTLLEDRVTLQVRQAFRRLEQARQSYEIQARSVELAEQRVESTQLLLQAGRANQRDVLEAQQALVEAQNALTRAVVDHTIAGLEFQRDVGTLTVNQEGQIHGWILSRGDG